MNRKHVAVFTLVAALAGLSGCGFLPGDSGYAYLIGFADGRAYLEDYEEWSGFVTLPSTIWELDLESAEITQIATARVQYDTQAAGDYYVAERPTEDEQGSQIVAVRISTGDESVVLERDVQLGGRYDRVFVLNGDQVVAITGEGLLLYDLAAQQVGRTIAVDDTLVEIHAASDEWVLVQRDDVYAGDELLINLDNEEVTEVPSPPDDYLGYFFDAVFADEYMFAAGLGQGAGDAPALLALHLPTMSWEIITEYGASGGLYPAGSRPCRGDAEWRLRALCGAGCNS